MPQRGRHPEPQLPAAALSWVRPQHFAPGQPEPQPASRLPEELPPRAAWPQPVPREAWPRSPVFAALAEARPPPNSAPAAAGEQSCAERVSPDQPETRPHWPLPPYPDSRLGLPAVAPPPVWPPQESLPLPDAPPPLPVARAVPGARLQPSAAAEELPAPSPRAASSRGWLSPHRRPDGPATSRSSALPRPRAALLRRSRLCPSECARAHAPLRPPRSSSSASSSR